MKYSRQIIALASILSLVACGGGDKSDGDVNSGATKSFAHTSGIASVSTNDTIIVIKPATGSDGNKISFEKGSLTKNGVVISSLDDVPAGVANHVWRTSATLPKGNLRIQFRPGTYRLKNGWVWPANATGRDATHQVIVEKVSGDVIISGAESVVGTYSSSTGLVSAATSITPIDQVWSGGQRAIRARTPNAGSFFYIQAGAQGWPTSTTNPTVVGSLNGAPVARQAFQADQSGFESVAKLVAGNEANASIVIMDSWQVSRHKVAELDQVGKRVRFTPTSNWDLAVYGKGQRYFIENALSALDAPGEWYWSQTSGVGSLKYKPNTALTDGAKITFEVPRIDKLLRVQGTGDSANWAKYLQFSGLKFQYAKSSLPSGGYVDPQADVWVSAAIEINDAKNIEFYNCEVSRTGGYGIWLNSRVRNTQVTWLEMFDLGAGAVKIGKARSPVLNDQDAADRADLNATGSNTIVGNRIHDTGHVYPGSVAVWIGRSSGNTVVDNLIKNTTYSGISVGWNWDASNSYAQSNIINRNFLYGIGQGVLADMGGIYLLGRAPGTTVTNNVIKEVRSYDGYTSGGNGIYADEGSSELIINNNVVYGVSGRAFTLHYGESNVVQNNTFANMSEAFGVGKRNGTSQLVPVELKNNAFFPIRNNFVGLANDDTLMKDIYSSNPTWIPVAPSLVGNKVSSQFLGSGVALAIPGLCTGCVADNSMSIRDMYPLDVPSMAGTMTNGDNLSGSWEGIRLTATTSAAVAWAGDPLKVPSLLIDFQASQWPEKATNLVGWQVISQQDKLVDQTDTTPPVQIVKDASGVQFLAINDAARSSFGWEPFIQSWMKYSSGTARVKFVAKFDANTDLVHTWRADDSGEVEGPVFQVKANGTQADIIVNGQTRGVVPTGVWVTFTVSSPIVAGSTWSMVVSYPGQTSGIAMSGLQQKSAAWNYVGPVMFISQTNTKSTTAIKSIFVCNDIGSTPCVNP